MSGCGDQSHDTGVVQLFLIAELHLGKALLAASHAKLGLTRPLCLVPLLLSCCRGTGGTLFQLARVPWLAGVQSTNLRNYRSTAAYRAFLNTPAPKPPPTVSTLRAPGVRRRSRAAQTLRAPVVAPALSQAVRLSASNEFWPVRLLLHYTLLLLFC